jgi:hypothetical protein
VTMSGWQRVALRARHVVRTRTVAPVMRAARGRRVHAGRAGPPSSADGGLELPQQQLKAGPELDALVARARAQRQPPGIDPEYDLVQAQFDYVHYLLQEPLLRESLDTDPVRGFLADGWLARSSPNVHFSMPSYLRRYPEKALDSRRSPYLDWIERDRAAGAIADPARGIEQMAEVLGLEPAKVVDELVGMRTDVAVRLRTGTLGEMFARAAEVEPLIGAAWAETADVRVPPLANESVARTVAAIHACHRAAEFRGARVVIVTDRPRSDGGRRLAEQMVRADAVAAEDVVVLYTDASAGDGSRPGVAGIRHLDFYSSTVGVADAELHRGLVALLRSFGADAVVNVDSLLFYRMMPSYGRPLAATEPVYLYFGHSRRGSFGHAVGWSSRWLYAAIDLVQGFVTETAQVKSELVERYQLTSAQQARIHVLREPVDPAIEVVAARRLGSSRPVVGWDGRWEQGGGFRVVLDVARAMPEVDFRLWVPEDPRAPVPEALDGNVRVVSRRFDVHGEDPSGVDAWLDTSALDGTSGLLLDIAMTEVPIVAGLAGRDVLPSDGFWPVVTPHWAEAYVESLREVLSDPGSARRRSRRLRETLVRERTGEGFSEGVRLILERDPAEPSKT